MTTVHETIRQALQRAQWYNMIDDDTSKISQALSLLDSHAVVPREPTKDMSIAGFEQAYYGGLNITKDLSAYSDAIYKAMIQAAQEESDE